jgi:hypothetical protein
MVAVHVRARLLLVFFRSTCGPPNGANGTLRRRAKQVLTHPPTEGDKKTLRELLQHSCRQYPTRSAKQIQRSLDSDLIVCGSPEHFGLRVLSRVKPRIPHRQSVSLVIVGRQLDHDPLAVDRALLNCALGHPESFECVSRSLASPLHTGRAGPRSHS